MNLGSVRTEGEIAVLEEPRWIAAEVPFRANVRAGTQDDVQSLLLRLPNVLGDVVLTAEVVDAGARLMEIPKDVGGDGVQSHGAGFAEAVAPVGARHTGIVHLAGEDLIRMAVQLKLSIGNGKGMRSGWLR